MSNQLLLGLDIGGTRSAVVVGDGEGHAMAREEFPTAGPEATIARLIALGGRLCSGEAPAAVGITCGGPPGPGRQLLPRLWLLPALPGRHPHPHGRPDVLPAPPRPLPPVHDR